MTTPIATGGGELVTLVDAVKDREGERTRIERELAELADLQENQTSTRSDGAWSRSSTIGAGSSADTRNKRGPS